MGNYYMGHSQAGDTGGLQSNIPLAISHSLAISVGHGAIRLDAESELIEPTLRNSDNRRNTILHCDNRYSLQLIESYSTLGNIGRGAMINRMQLCNAETV